MRLTISSVMKYIKYMKVMKESSTRQLVTSVAQVIQTIQRYNQNAGDLADLMPYVRSWYALRTKGSLLFGPSKFIGYQDMTANEYRGSAYNSEKHGRVQNDGFVLDGRVTEGVLRRWSELVEEGHPQYESVHTALNEFCARYGKKPNDLARISIIHSEPSEARASFADELVVLLAAVFRGLTPAQQSAFRKQIA